MWRREQKKEGNDRGRATKKDKGGNSDEGSGWNGQKRIEERERAEGMTE